MRYLIIITFAFLLFPFRGMSQIAVNGGGGFNVSFLKTNGVDWISEAGIGYQAGATSTFGNYFYIEPGIFWIANNVDLIYIGNDNGITHGITYKYKTSSIRIPLLAGYHLIGNAENSFFDLRIFAGPSVSFLLNADEVGGLEKDEFSNVNWGLDAGLGVSVWLLYCNMGYEWGLNKTYQSQIAGNAKSEMFWMNVGIRFRL